MRIIAVVTATTVQPWWQRRWLAVRLGLLWQRVSPVLPSTTPPNPPTLLAPLIKFKCIYLTTTAHTVVPLMKLWSTALCTPPSFTPRHRRLPTLRCNDLARHRLSIEKITPVYVVWCVVAPGLPFRCFNNHRRHPTHGIPWRSFD